ncbi:ribonucleotide-diphosphate reductase subunit beta, partial [Pseudomonas aeruginosa]
MLDWDELEFDFSTCLVEFETCDKSTYDMMIKTLAWQWEADSVASRSIVNILSPVMTDSRVWAGYVRINDNEDVHALTYSEIVRNSFKDPKVILDEILRVEEAQERMVAVARTMGEAHDAVHAYALNQVPNDQELYNKVFMFFIALYFLERIQFMASFAVTFAIGRTGAFQQIAAAVKKIAQDEFEIHAQYGQE